MHGDSGERRAARFQKRDGDSPGKVFLAFLLRQAKARAMAVAGTLGAGVGTIITVVIFRVMVLDRVTTMEAQHSSRMTMIEIDAMLKDSAIGILDARADTLTEDLTSLVYAKCDEHSKAEQRRYRMRCPVELYRGAPR